MAIHAPVNPTTKELHNLYPLDETVQSEIAQSRKHVGDILSGEEEGIVGIIGACAMTDDIETIRSEGNNQQELTQNEEGLYIINRRPVWKPRTKPEDWHGLETDDPELSYRTLVQTAMDSAGVAIELNWQNEERTETHADRYDHILTLGWFGGRAVDDTELMKRVTTDEQKSLPLAVKNGLDGEIQPALDRVEEIRSMRGSGAAPVVLLYRGGENAKDPKAWERRYRDALERTNGHMIVDAAHGAEMAHDPGGMFKKSKVGQERALDHIEWITNKGGFPKGIMAEASDAHSPTDPHIRHIIALAALRRINTHRLLVTKQS